MESFKDLYTKLNAQQQKAVSTIDGPVMVIAGPGTGKTQILAARILNIRELTDIAPENILCLTYTDAGSNAMKERLSMFMGTDAYRVNIHTFHSLCNKIITDYPEHFSMKELRVMDDLERIEIIEAIRDSLPHESTLKTYSEYNQSTQETFHKLWSIMQELNLTPEIINTYVSEFKDIEVFKEIFPDTVYKRATNGNKTGDLNEKKAKEYFDSWEKLIKASQLKERYTKIKEERGVYEFSDMIDWVYKKLKEDVDFRREIQERYHYVLVDEFQDTSKIQSDLLDLLIDYWGDNPNCFVVGDDDQSIYAFQGAQVSNMLRFKSKYQNHLQVVILTENYRSSQEILDASGRFISNNSERLVNSNPEYTKTLIKGIDGPNMNYLDKPFRINQFSNKFQEAASNAYEIKELIEKQKINPNEIAIIYSKHKAADEYIELFRELEIPFVLNKNIDILNEPIINLLQNWLNYLKAELDIPNSGEHLLYPILLSDLYSISPYSLNRLSLHIHQLGRDKYKENKTRYTWREHIHLLLHDKIECNYLDENEKVVLRKLWNNKEKWIKLAASENTNILISMILSEGGFVEYAAKSADSIWNMEMLNTFLEFVRLQCEKEPKLSLLELMTKFRTMEQSSIAIKLEKRLGNSRGVQFLTAHSSKGLEFEYVYIIQATSNMWVSSRSSSSPYRIKQLLEAHKRKIVGSQTENQILEEKRRLFFVAVTRAKKEVRISYPAMKFGAKSNTEQAAIFIGELYPEFLGKEIKSEKVSLEVQEKAQKYILSHNGKPFLKKVQKEWLDQRISEFVFSPSSLNSILKCGIQFFYGQLVRIPSPPSEYASYGIAMHSTLRKLIENWSKKQKWPSDEEFIETFEYQMKKERGNFTEKQYNNRLQQGKSVIPFFLSQKKEEYLSYPDVKTEFGVKSIIGDVSIKGNIDKLIIRDKQVSVVDYKTSKLSNISKYTNAPNPKKPNDVPSSYWFQIGIYALMINENHEYSYKCSTGAIEALNEDENGIFNNYPLYYSPEDFELIRKWIQIAHEQLISKEFLKGCGDDKCEYCNFAIETGLAEIISEVDPN